MAKRCGMTRPKVIDLITGVSRGDLNALVRSAMRKIWRSTSRKQFLLKARVPHIGPDRRKKFDVICSKCDKRMGFSEKAFRIKKDGKPTKNKKLVYEIDHLGEGNHPLLNIESDLGKYAITLLYGQMRVLCWQCHADRTKDQFKK